MTDKPTPIQVNLQPLNLTAELQKVQLSRSLSKDENADLQVLILDAAAALGMDGQGRDGLFGYLKFAASTYPKQYMALLSKVLPMQIESKSTMHVIEHVNIVSVPPDHYMPPPVPLHTTPSFPATTLEETSPTESPPSFSSPSPLDPAVQTIEDVLNNPVPVDLPKAS